MNTLRKFWTGSVALVLLLILALAGTPCAVAQMFTSFDVPSANGTMLTDVNDHGVIVGRYAQAGKWHGFIYDGANYTFVDYPGAAWTEVWGINNQGDVVGQYGYNSDNLIHGFLLTKVSGVFTNIDKLGQFNTMPQGINRAGFIVGCFHNPGTMHGWVMQNGAFLSVGAPAYEMYTGVNNSGTIVGWYGTITGTYSFMLSGTGRTEFQYPGANNTQAQGLNSDGDVVGVYADVAGSIHGFLLSNGEFATIDFSGAASTRAFGINASGTIVGMYKNATGPQHGFIRQPN